MVGLEEVDLVTARTAAVEEEDILEEMGVGMREGVGVFMII